MADDAFGRENPFFFLSEHIKDKGFGYDFAFLFGDFCDICNTVPKACILPIVF